MRVRSGSRLTGMPPGGAIRDWPRTFQGELDGRDATKTDKRRRPPQMVQQSASGTFRLSHEGAGNRHRTLGCSEARLLASMTGAREQAYKPAYQS